MSDSIEKIKAAIQQIGDIAAEEMIKGLPNVPTDLVQSALNLELSYAMTDETSIKLVTALKNELIKRGALVTN